MGVIFSTPELLEDCLIGETAYKCVCSSIDESIVYGDMGAVDDVNFTLSLKLPLKKMPTRGQKVKFRDCTYKVADVTTDSAGTSIALHLQSLSKG